MLKIILIYMLNIEYLFILLLGSYTGSYTRYTVNCI
jgi:hypothetical protein